MDTLENNPEMLDKILDLKIFQKHNDALTDKLNKFDKCVSKKHNVNKCTDELNNLIVELHKDKRTEKYIYEKKI